MSNIELIKNSYKEAKRERIEREANVLPPKKKPKIKPVEVKLTYIDLPFWNMVNFMVMVAIAAIPAIIILFILGVALVAVFGGIGSISR